MNRTSITIPTSIGQLYLATDDGVCLTRVEFHANASEASTTLATAPAILQSAAQQCLEYLAGKRSQFEIPLSFSGTPFQEAVWRALQQIPFGKTLSYKQVAQAIGNPKAVRAIGGACNRNPLPLIIPCHRVVASNGLGGFGGGVEIKKVLLELEKPNS